MAHILGMLRHRFILIWESRFKDELHDCGVVSQVGHQKFTHCNRNLWIQGIFHGKEFLKGQQGKLDPELWMENDNKDKRSPSGFSADTLLFGNAAMDNCGQVMPAMTSFCWSKCLCRHPSVTSHYRCVTTAEHIKAVHIYVPFPPLWLYSLLYKNFVICHFNEFLRRIKSTKWKF